MKTFFTPLHGFCMAVADSVPGISGGTVAFVMGFYEELLGSVGSLAGKNRTRRTEAVSYLCRFCAGWLPGMALCILVLSRIFSTHIYVLSSAFMGLSVAAVFCILNEKKSVLKNSLRYSVFIAVGAFSVVALSMLRNFFSGSSAADFSALRMWQCLYVFLSGAAASSAMILPGISGSIVLLICGVYVPAVSALKAAYPGTCVVILYHLEAALHGVEIKQLSSDVKRELKEWFCKNCTPQEDC